jgi:RHS repeat-associated protein
MQFSQKLCPASPPYGTPIFFALLLFVACFTAEAALAPPNTTEPGSLTPDGPTHDTYDVRLRWERVTGAAGYEVYIRDLDKAADNFREASVGDVTSYTFDDLIQGHRHRWNMRARDANGNLSGISQTRFFVVGRPDLRFVGTPDVELEVYPGENVRIDFTVRNSGDGESKTCKTRLQVKFEDHLETLVEEFNTLPTLDVDEDNDEISTLEIPANAAPGLYSVHLILDYEDVNVQSDTDNDTLSLWSVFRVLGNSPNITPFEPSGWDDKIVVSKVTGTHDDDTPLYPTDTLYVDWSIVNNGEVPTAVRFYTQMFIDDVFFTAWFTDPPMGVGGANAHEISDINIGSLSIGNHTIKIKTDSADAISEASENDNEFSRTFSVSAPLSISVATPNSGNPLSACNPYSIIWTITGDTATISYFKFAYSLNGGSTFTALGDSISSASSSLSWTPHALHSTQARVRIRAYNSFDQILAEASNPDNFVITIPNGNPTANPATLNNSPKSGLPVQFYGYNSTRSSSCSEIIGYSWNFADGTTSFSVNPTHTFYPANGSTTYYVTLTVTDANGQTDQKTLPIYVSGQSLGAANQSSFSIDPVNLATGNYIYEHSDLRLPGKGFPFDFKRFYNSKFSDQSGLPMGFGWTHSYDIRLATTATNATVTFGDSHSEIHILSGGQYSAEAGVYGILTNHPDSSFTLMGKDRTRRNFDGLGRLTSIVDKNANTLSLTYSNSALAIIADASGRQIFFQSDTSGLITRLTDPLGRAIQFIYDGQTNLVAVIDANNGTNRYSYDTNHQMTAAFDARDTKYMENTYDDLQRVVSYQTDAYTNGTSFLYDFINNVTIVTNALGKTSIHRHDDRLLITNIVDEAGNQQVFGYDINRNRTFIRDKNGNPTLYAYDTRGNVTNKTDALTNVTSIEYNALSNPTRRIDALTNVTSFGYDSRGNLTSTTNALDFVSRVQYDTNGLPIILTDARGFSTTNNFDSQGNLAAMIDAKSFTNRFEHDLVGRKIRQIDALNRTNSFVFDNNDNLLFTTNALGFVYAFTYDRNNNRITSRNPHAATGTNVFDLKDRLIATLAPLNQTNGASFDPLDRKFATFDALGNQTRYGFDDIGNLIAVTNALNQVTRFTFDPQGNQTSAIDPTGHYLTNFFDALDRKTATIDISISTNLIQFNALGRVIASTSANGQVTRFDFDALGRLTNVVDAANQFVFFGYDENGNRSLVTDPNGHSWTNIFDELNRPTEQRNPDGTKTVLRYDPVGNVTNKVTPNGDSINYSYDPLNRLTNIAYPSGLLVSFAYDSVGNRTNMTDGLGTTAWQFDLLNRLTSVTDPYGQTVSNGFDANGNRTSLTYPGSNVVTYGFDALNRLTAFTNWLGGVVNYGFDMRGNMNAATNANGTIVSYDFDVANRLIALTNATSSASVIAAYALTLDGVGNHQQSAQAQPVFPILSNQTNIYTYDSDNHLTSLDGQTVTHNPNGDLTSIGMNTYAFDFEDRLVQLSLASTSNTFAYDGLGNRLARTISGQSRRFVLDRMGTLTQALVETDTNNAPVAFYVYGAGLADRITPAGQTATYHFNLQGSTVALTDSGGNVTDAYAYDSFGVLANADGDLVQPFRYLGRYGIIDDSTGLYHARARYFSPELGRFITKDPLTGKDGDGQSLNRYVYALNSPLRLLDISGMSPSEGRLATRLGATDESHFGLLMNDRERQIYILRLKAQAAQQNYVYALEVQDAYYQAAINFFGALSKIGEVAGYAVDILTLGESALARKAISQATKRGIAYESLFEAPISGASRSAHRASANNYLANELQNNSNLAGRLNQELGGDVLQHMQSGSSLLNPPGTVWHHPFDNPNAVQLLRNEVHTDPALQNLLHPDGIGGFGNYYGR